MMTDYGPCYDEEGRWVGSKAKKVKKSETVEAVKAIFRLLWRLAH